MKNTIIIVLSIICISLGVWIFMNKQASPIVETPPIVSEKPPVQVEPPVQEEPATQKDIAQNESLIVESPLIEVTITSPLKLEGKVRGSWLFEATAPVTLTDWDGRIIAEGYIEAQEDWMTTEFIPFKGTLTFETPQNIGTFSNRGSLIFQKSNPSDLPENDDALEYTVWFW